MTIQELHWEIKFRYNKLDSNHRKDFVPAELDRLLNYSVIPDYVEICTTGNNYKKYKIPFEATVQRIDMISTLIVKQPEQPSITPTFDATTKSYECKFSDLEYPYRHFIRAYILTDCGGITLFPHQLVDNTELNILLRDKQRRPSKKWKRVIGSIGRSSNGVGSSLYIYTNGEITISEVFIEYIKDPVKVFFSGYDTLEFESSGTGYESSDPAVTSDIPETYHGVLVDLAVQTLSNMLGDTNKVNLTQDKLLNTL